MNLLNISKSIEDLYSELQNSSLVTNVDLDELSTLLISSVKKRAIGKIGVAFSGGVDSALISFICSKLGLKAVLYNVGLEGSHDAIAANEVASHYKWNLKQKVVSFLEAEEVIKKVVKILPDPSVVKVGVACPELVVLEEAKKDGCDVVLTGLGSEEIFAGYQRHSESSDVHAECWKGLKAIYERDLIRDLAVSKFIGVEISCPFLDKDLIKFSMCIDPSLKIKEGVSKWVLRKAAMKIGLKEEFAFRPKKAAQYGSGFDKVITKLAKKNGFKFKKDYLESLK